MPRVRVASRPTPCFGSPWARIAWLLLFAALLSLVIVLSPLKDGVLVAATIVKAHTTTVAASTSTSTSTCRLRDVERSAGCAALFQSALDILGDGEWVIGASSSSDAAPEKGVCAAWSCTCQGLSDRYGTAHMGGWGSAPEEGEGDGGVRQWWMNNACQTQPRETNSGSRVAAAAAALPPAMWRINAKYSDAATAFNQWTGLSLARCGGRRVVVYGSSFARTIMWSMMSMFTGTAPTRAEKVMPSYNMAATKCHSEVNYKGSAVWCENAEWKARPEVCRYPRDTGLELEKCGWPHAKLWRFNLATGATSSPATRTIQHFSSVVAHAGPLAINTFQAVYGFKSWPRTPVADAEAYAQFAALKPDIVIVESYVWGFSPDGFPASSSRRHSPHVDADVDAEGGRRIDAMLEAIETHLPGEITVVHLLETEWGTSGSNSGYAARSAQVRAAVARLPLRKQRRHLFFDRAAVLAKTAAERRSEHGYYGDASDAWARMLTLLLCNDMEEGAAEKEEDQV